jgi:hypothetical protein
MYVLVQPAMMLINNKIKTQSKIRNNAMLKTIHRFSSSPPQKNTFYHCTVSPIVIGILDQHEPNLLSCKSGKRRERNLGDADANEEGGGVKSKHHGQLDEKLRF